MLLATPTPTRRPHLQALESSLRLDGVITVVDSLNVTKYLANAETSHDVRMQLAFADRILLNKSDLVTPDKVRGDGERGGTDFVCGLVSLASLYMYYMYVCVCRWPVSNRPCGASTRRPRCATHPSPRSLLTGCWTLTATRSPT